MSQACLLGRIRSAASADDRTDARQQVAPVGRLGNNIPDRRQRTYRLQR
jgi:hypothetical protein